MLSFDVIAERPVDGVVMLVVSGDLDVLTVDRFVGAAWQAIDKHPDATLRLDLKDVGFIDSTGINGLISLKAAEAERGRRLELADSSPYVERVLRLVGLADMFM